MFAAMSKPTLVDVAEKRLAHATLMASWDAPRGTPKYERLLANCLEGVLHVIRATPHFAPEHAMALKELLEKTLPPASVETIMASFSSKIKLAFSRSSGSPYSCEKQTHFYLDEYLTEQLWKKFEDLNADPKANLIHMAGHFANLSLCRASEKN
jgi:hypothetical protein